MDCIILAGNRENYREVSNQDNKAFLKIGDRSIIQIMLAELAKVSEIDRCLVVGPKQSLSAHLDESYREAYPKPLLIFEQKNDLVENVLAVLDSTGQDLVDNRVALILPSDIPLLVAEEVRQFIQRCDMDHCDYAIGMTTEKALARFLPGVVMNCFYCYEYKIRLNNMHLVRASGVRKINYIRRSYSMRYQKEWRNILTMIMELLRLFYKTPGAVFLYLIWAIVTRLYGWGWNWAADLLRRILKISHMERCVGRFMETRFRMVITDFGGSAIDVDNEKDYLAICQGFEKWIEGQRALAVSN